MRLTHIVRCDKETRYGATTYYYKVTDIYVENSEIKDIDVFDLCMSVTTFLNSLFRVISYSRFKLYDDVHHPDDDIIILTKKPRCRFYECVNIILERSWNREYRVNITYNLEHILRDGNVDSFVQLLKKRARRKDSNPTLFMISYILFDVKEIQDIVVPYIYELKLKK